MSKLAIAAETEEDRYETSTKVICLRCKVDNIDRSFDGVGVSCYKPAL